MFFLVKKILFFKLIFYYNFLEKKIKVKEKCVDIWKNCRKNKKFCKHESYINMMKQNCAKTCGFCKPTKNERKQTIKNTNSECQDNHPSYV